MKKILLASTVIVLAGLSIKTGLEISEDRNQANHTSAVDDANANKSPINIYQNYLLAQNRDIAHAKHLVVTMDSLESNGHRIVRMHQQVNDMRIQGSYVRFVLSPTGAIKYVTDNTFATFETNEYESLSGNDAIASALAATETEPVKGDIKFLKRDDETSVYQIEALDRPALVSKTLRLADNGKLDQILFVTYDSVGEQDRVKVTLNAQAEVLSVDKTALLATLRGHKSDPDVTPAEVISVHEKNFSDEDQFKRKINGRYIQVFVDRNSNGVPDYLQAPKIGATAREFTETGPTVLTATTRYSNDVSAISVQNAFYHVTHANRMLTWAGFDKISGNYELSESGDDRLQVRVHAATGFSESECAQPDDDEVNTKRAIPARASDEPDWSEMDETNYRDYRNARPNPPTYNNSASTQNRTDTDSVLPQCVNGTAYFVPGRNDLNAFIGLGQYRVPGGSEYKSIALDPSVVYHEYGHAVHNRLLENTEIFYTLNIGSNDYCKDFLPDRPGDYLFAHGNNRAVSEAIGDAISLTLTKNNEIGRWSFGTIRQYPEDTDGNVKTLNDFGLRRCMNLGAQQIAYDNAEILAGALYDLRKGLNYEFVVMGEYPEKDPDAASRAVHNKYRAQVAHLGILVRAMKAAGENPSFLDIRDAMKASSSGYYCQIDKAFAERGMGLYAQIETDDRGRVTYVDADFTKDAQNCPDYY